MDMYGNISTDMDPDVGMYMNVNNINLDIDGR